jgi:RNA polymerase sigma-70 factor, ECF subfamily
MRNATQVAEPPPAVTPPREPAPLFEDFFEAWHVPLYRALWLVTRNRHEAEEVMQDAFLKVWERWEQVGAMEDPVGYLYRTAMNLFRKRYRRAVLAIRRSLGFTPTRDDFADADDRQDVRRILSTLPSRQRAALVLTEMLGFSPDEAGHALGVRASTVRSLSCQGRESFRNAMEVDDA